MTELTGEGLQKPAEPKEVGQVDIEKSPYKADIKDVASQYFPNGEYMKSKDGSEYILDENKRTIILFGGNKGEGFTTIYSPLTPQELRRRIASLPDEQQRELVDQLHLPDVITEPEKAIKMPIRWGNLKSLGLDTMPHDIHQRITYNPLLMKTSITEPEKGVPRDTDDSDIPPEDLPQSHFLELSQEEYETKKQKHWEAVKDLPDNDVKKILYYRRFTKEFVDTMHISWIGQSGTKLIAELRNTSNQFSFYGVDSSRIGELPKVEPYTPKIEVPQGKRIGFVIGYHHLEKPWGNLFMEMFQKQVQYSADQIEFILIQNGNIPTGVTSSVSEEEIQQAIKERGITDIIDVHEMLSVGVNYHDTQRASKFNGKFAVGESKNPNGGMFTLDPFIPRWAIEQYYEGNIYPQLQDAVNEQIKKSEILIGGMND